MPSSALRHETGRCSFRNSAALTWQTETVCKYTVTVTVTVMCKNEEPTCAAEESGDGSAKSWPSGIMAERDKNLSKRN